MQGKIDVTVEYFNSANQKCAIYFKKCIQWKYNNVDDHNNTVFVKMKVIMQMIHRAESLKYSAKSQYALKIILKNKGE